MLLRAKPVTWRRALRTVAELSFGLALALTQAACDGLESEGECESVAPKFEPIGPELFVVDHVFMPGSTALHRDGERVQFVDLRDGQPVLEVRATLSATVVEAIDEAEHAIRDGDGLGSFDGQCLAAVGQSSSRLSLGVYASELSFRYPWACPPSALAELDAMLSELVNSLPSCSPTPLVTDCEIVDG